MNNRDLLDCLVFGLSRGVVSAQRQPRPRLEERFPPSAEPETAPAKNGGIVSRLWQILCQRRPSARLSLHRRLQHCG
ncbi:MAG: hypothetical protein E6Q98_09910 [Rhodospirillaceae bacterium]|nr:MAG: hypothetical protein E6Q98_09910 [Rhodospirillaceae bacterium]